MDRAPIGAACVGRASFPIPWQSLWGVMMSLKRHGGRQSQKSRDLAKPGQSMSSTKI